MEPDFFVAASEEHINREKNKARELRHSQWWKNKCASGRCHYCLETFSPKALTMDHIVPLSRGGCTSRSNIVPCCKECNSQKQNMLPIEWQDYLEQLSQRKN
tara:strand:- start:176 stop:481 length:306 start_codon:yes stop_codon:yes gene_type:complete